MKTAPTLYSLVFVIHGDASYVFHDTVGVAHYADQEALAKAQTVARANPEAEVFIFHDKPLRRTLFLFKQPDADFYYYRNGKLAATHSFWRYAGNGAARFAAHGALYNQFRSKQAGALVRPTRMLLYFGHEIPEVEGLHYDESYPDSTLTVKQFSNALRDFSSDTKHFDLAVVSTCFNGTPHSIAALTPHTRYVIASPTNLHLSYLDIAPFEHLESTLGRRDMASFARIVAKNAFDKLAASVQTVISVATYDAAAVEAYTQSITTQYNQSLAAIAAAPVLTLAHCDCAEQAPFSSPLMNTGVEVLYRPAMFGPGANKLQHSGWSCWKTTQ